MTVSLEVRSCYAQPALAPSQRMPSVRETEILVEQQPPQGVIVCDHAGLVINEFSSRHSSTLSDT